MSTAQKKIAPHVGTRVVLAEEYDSFPEGVFAAGLAGTVTIVEEKLIAVTLDQTRTELEDWGNAIQIYPEHIQEDNGEATMLDAFWRVFKYEPSLTDPMCVQYNAYEKEQGITLGSADEHLFDEDLTEAQRVWVRAFYDRWVLTENIEQDIRDLRMLAAKARCEDNDEWGSERQVEAQNNFGSAVEKILPAEEWEKYEDWCARATTDEMIDFGQQLAVAELLKKLEV